MLTADDCSKSLNLLSQKTVRCTTTVSGKNAEISINLKSCRAKPSVTLGIKVDLDVDWEMTFDNSVEIPIPGLSAFDPDLGVNLYIRYLRVVIEGRDGDIYLKV